MPKIQNSPAALGWCAGLLVLLLGVVANASCAHASKLDGRDVEQRFEQAVQITANCLTSSGEATGWYGSGVIVNPTTILTAAHVATEGDVFCVFEAEMQHGKTYAMHVGVLLPEYDLASMHTAEGERFDPTFPIVFGPVPRLGERICAATAFPRRLTRCGDAQTQTDPPGNLIHTAIVEPGNSGSGVYDDRGRLIGIVTHLWYCSNKQYCGGRVATLEGHVGELLRGA